MRGPTGKTGEYYLTDAYQYMIDHGAKIRVEEVQGWYDAGQVDTLLDTNRHLLEHAGRARKPDGGVGVRVHEPVRIAEGVTLSNCELGPNVTVESGTTIRNSKLRDSIVGADTKIEGCDLQRSLIGDRAVVRGARGTINVSDYAEIDLSAE